LALRELTPVVVVPESRSWNTPVSLTSIAARRWCSFRSYEPHVVPHWDPSETHHMRKTSGSGFDVLSW